MTYYMYNLSLTRPFQIATCIYAKLQEWPISKQARYLSGNETSRKASHPLIPDI